MTPPISFADLLAAIASDDRLTPVQRRNAASSVRSIATHLKLDLNLPANFGVLRSASARFDPLVVGISRKRWANIRSEVAGILRRYGAPTRPPLPKHLGAPWRELRGRLDDLRLARGLSRLIHWASKSNIPPESVDDATMDRFHQHLLTESLEKRPNKVHQRTCVLWNRAVSQIPGWPQAKVKVPSYRDILLLPPETFPSSLIEELDTWEATMSHAKEELFSTDAPTRALRPATIVHRRSGYLRFASALVHCGYALTTLTGLAKLVEIPAFKAGLQYLYERAGRTKTPSLVELAGGLVGLARHWVRVSPEHLNELRNLTRGLECRKRGMTQKNLERLRQFDDVRKQSALINLPERLVALAKKKANPKKAALLVQTALAVDLELMAPIRLANLSGLNLRRHFSFGLGARPKLVYVDIPGFEVKNNESLHIELPPSTARLIALYRTQYRPLLVSGADDGWLFPGAGLDHKNAMTLSEQVCKAIARYAGLRMNVHLFRHLAAKLFLDGHPGEYESVRQFLGHKNLQTTIDFYCIFEVSKAIRRHDEVVLKLKIKPLRSNKRWGRS